MLFICICKLGSLSWPGNSWKIDCNLIFSWLNKGTRYRQYFQMLRKKHCVDTKVFYYYMFYYYYWNRPNKSGQNVTGHGFGGFREVLEILFYICPFSLSFPYSSVYISFPATVSFHVSSVTLHPLTWEVCDLSCFMSVSPTIHLIPSFIGSDYFPSFYYHIFTNTIPLSLINNQ